LTGQGPVPLIISDVLELVVGELLSCVADQHVQVPELADRGVDDGTAVRGIGHVVGHQHRLAACLLDPLAGLFRVVVLIEVRDQHVGAFAGEPDGHGPADAAVRS
jgi:hypothetical protein